LAAIRYPSVIDPGARELFLQESSKCGSVAFALGGISHNQQTGMHLPSVRAPRQPLGSYSSRITGDGPAAERAQAIERVFVNGLEAARRGSSDPDLRIIKPLAEESGVCALRCATVLAETTTRDVFFGQAVIQHPHGVVYLTYEAPFVDGAEQTFHDLLRMIHES
jgi:hypothetical protein